jgi:hypothetical protein
MQIRKQWDDEQRRRITLSVLQNIYGRLASVASRKLNPRLTESELINLEADKCSLEVARTLVESGEDLESTKNPQLFVMRELAVGGLTCMLRDGEYILVEGQAWFTCGAATALIRQDKETNSLRIEVYPLLREESVMLASCEVSYDVARQAAEATAG